MKKSCVFILFLFLFYACEKADCNTVKSAFYPIEYNLVVTEENIDAVWLKAMGSIPFTNEKTSIMVHNNWILNSNEVDYGDTIMKKKGELILTVHKKDTIIVRNWHCEGKIYK